MSRSKSSEDRLIAGEDLLRCFSPVLSSMRLFGLYFRAASPRIHDVSGSTKEVRKTWNVGRIYSAVILVTLWLNAARMLSLFHDLDEFEIILLLRLAMVSTALLFLRWSYRLLRGMPDRMSGKSSPRSKTSRLFSEQISSSTAAITLFQQASSGEVDSDEAAVLTSCSLILSQVRIGRKCGRFRSIEADIIAWRLSTRWYAGFWFS